MTRGGRFTACGRGRRTPLVAGLAVVCLTLVGCTGSGAAEASPQPGRALAESSATATPGPAPSSTPIPTPTPTIGRGEGELRVLTFRGYAEYGGIDAGVNWVSPFEKATGCRVSAVQMVRTSEQMAEAYERSAYDVISAPPDLADALITAGAVRPLDTGLVGDYAKVAAWLPAVERGGKVYGVPYLWDIDQLLHRTGDAARNDGWPRLYATSRAALRDSPLSIAAAALALKRSDPKLGVKNPFRLSPAQLDKAVQLLAANAEGDRVRWSDSLRLIDALVSEQVRIAQASPYHLSILRAAGKPFQAPAKQPMIGWADSWMISAKAANPNCAYRWLDWMSSAEAQRQAAAWTGRAPANPKACTGPAKRVCDAFHVRDKDWLGRVTFAAPPSGDCGGAECVGFQEWTARWRALNE
jgi:putative spermidine/putrescine transport system substrate-binding protein